MQGRANPPKAATPMSALKSRGTSWGSVVRDPDVHIGRYRVLARTDGQYAIVDESRPLGDRTIALARTVDEAKKKVEKLPP